MSRTLLVVALLVSPAWADGPIYSGVKKSRAPQMRKLQEACDRKDAAACDKLGNIYQKSFFASDGEQTDGDRAFALYKRSCDLGSVDGCSDLGWTYAEGMGVGRDFKAAEKLYQKGCDAGHIASCGLLGSLYATDWDGKGPNPLKDLPRARKIFERVCNGKIDGLGCISGCGDLASNYYYGARGQEKNLAEAARLYERDCDAGCSNSCDSGARMFKTGEGVTRDAAKAARMYQRACDIGLTPSCVDLGEMYRDGVGVVASRDRASELFKRGCTRSRGQVSGCQGDPKAGPLLRTLR
jgi:TPR repeat protein